MVLVAVQIKLNFAVKIHKPAWRKNSSVKSKVVHCGVKNNNLVANIRMAFVVVKKPHLHVQQIRYIAGKNCMIPWENLQNILPKGK